MILATATYFVVWLASFWVTLEDLGNLLPRDRVDELALLGSPAPARAQNLQRHSATPS